MTVSPADFMAATPRSLTGNSEWASRYARELRGVINRHAKLAPRSLQVHLGPSEIGAACDRQIAGKLAGIMPTNNVSDPWPSITGTAVHAWLATAFQSENEREKMLRWITETAVAPHPDYPGHSDLYDAWEQTVCDWKILGPTSLSKIKSPKGPSQRYVIQLLLYGAGFRLAGLPVKRVAIAALPRTASTLDGMFVWERPYTPADDEIVRQVLERTAMRKILAGAIREGRMRLTEVPAAPDADECFWLQGAHSTARRQRTMPAPAARARFPPRRELRRVVGAELHVSVSYSMIKLRPVPTARRTGEPAAVDWDACGGGLSPRTRSQIRTVSQRR